MTESLPLTEEQTIKVAAFGLDKPEPTSSTLAYDFTKTSAEWAEVLMRSTLQHSQHRTKTTSKGTPMSDSTPLTETSEEVWVTFDPEPWVVHVKGPDDILPADGMLDAIRQAHAINEATVGPDGYYGRATEDRPLMTYVWAVPTKESWL